MISEREIITRAAISFGPLANNDLLYALECFYMNGVPDSVCGNVECGCHYYRVNRWIVQTDSQGFHEIFAHENEAEAISQFEEIEKAVYPYA